MLSIVSFLVNPFKKREESNDISKNELLVDTINQCEKCEQLIPYSAMPKRKRRKRIIVGRVCKDCKYQRRVSYGKQLSYSEIYVK